MPIIPEQYDIHINKCNMNVLCIFITFNVLSFKCCLEFGPAFGVVISTTSVKESRSKTADTAACEQKQQDAELSFVIMSGDSVFRWTVSSDDCS